MKTLLLIVCISTFIFQALAQNCTGYQNCDDCAAVQGCGWCAPTQQCLSGNVTGPADGVCVGSAWEYGKCTPCGSFTDCRTCLVYDQDCFWCQSANNGAGACKPIGFVGCPYTKSCPCGTYGGCSQCIDDPNCHWCATIEQCLGLKDDCGNQPTYNITSPCPCEVNTDCTSCRETSGCRWCESAPGFCSNELCPGPAATTCQSYCEGAASNCESCNNLPGCAWCPSSSSCVDASTSSCALQKTCAACNFSRTCDSCTTSPFCVWCEDTASCQPSGTNCFITHSCDVFCNGFTSCENCNLIPGCGWCDDEQKCSDVNVANCFFTHSCGSEPTTKCGFDRASFVGGMFLVLGATAVGIVAYVFYRYRTSSRATYTELK